MKHQVLRKSISGRVLPGLPPQKLTAIFGVPSRPVTRPEMFTAYTTIITTIFVTIISILFCSVILSSNDISALSYQSNTGVQFTINPTISINVSGDLIINDLTPGNSSDSNIITITTSSNAIAGYGLYSTVGNSTNNSTELRKDGTDTTNKFSSITTNKSSLSDFNGSDWGYSYSTDSGVTWISGDITSTTATGYNGLPLYTTESPIKLINTTTSGSSSVQFKIGAKASNSQIAGDYTNVINFIGIANPNPAVISDLTYMQDFATLSPSQITEIKNNMATGAQYKLIDNRDNQAYWIAKQADGNIWMTQNLDLCIGCTGVASLTSDNTDLTTSGTAPYVTGYSTSGGVITWSPSSKTSDYTASGTTVSPAMPSGNAANSAPYSAEGGDRYYYTTGTTSDETMQTLAQCKASHTEEECAHYHAGNYYNWTAAIASNASSGISTQYANAANSICPKGWKLPSGRASSDTSTTRQFGYLWQRAGVTSSLTATSYASGGFNKIRTSPLFFVRGGYVYGSSLDNGGIIAYYWSSTVYKYVYRLPRPLRQLQYYLRRHRLSLPRPISTLYGTVVARSVSSNPATTLNP